VAIEGNPDPLKNLLSPEEFIKQFLGDKPEGFLFDEVVKEEDLLKEQTTEEVEEPKEKDVPRSPTATSPKS